MERFQRLNDRKKRSFEYEAATSLLALSISVDDDQELEVKNPSCGCQTELSGEDIESLQADNAALRSENQALKCDVASTAFTEDSIRDDKIKLNFYTGIETWTTFAALLTLITKCLSTNANSKITVAQQLLLFLMKLRLNLANQDLAYRFRVSTSTVSSTFHKILDIMAVKTASLIHWPTPPTLHLSMPTAFRKYFKKCAIILDCTEVFIEQPSDLQARAQTWSQYKHHNTIKVLIGITPQGTVSFLSKCWGGRASDKEITEKSNILSFLEPGDVVIADRGFTIGDFCGLALAEVKIPPFTRGVNQLEKKEVDWSRELSIVRIHVERVIGTVKQKYTLLQSTIPIALIGNRGDGNETMDKIFQVCCALYNICPSVVPLD